ncbi:Uncharacterised protein [Shimwellia blattae]|nr:Uncharacterised protein [Shimwellia blattae]
MFLLTYTWFVSIITGLRAYGLTGLRAYGLTGLRAYGLTFTLCSRIVYYSSSFQRNYSIYTEQRYHHNA